MILGSLEPDQWKDQNVWREVITTHRIIVSTPQVLLDALRHGFVVLGRDISLLVLDEAHHCADKHPYNLIMSEFYVLTPSPRTVGHIRADTIQRPFVLGLTASPMFGGDVDGSFR